MSEFVGATHDFHDLQYARRWSSEHAPTSIRTQLFDTIVNALSANRYQAGHIVELGSGPGYLAMHVLKALPDFSYECVDFSQPMLDIAMARLQDFAGRVRFTQADLVKGRWESDLHRPISAIVSTWALHDLGSEANIASVYGTCKTALQPGGILLNGDFIKPEDAVCQYEPGRITVARHLELLNEFGYHDVRCLAILEKELVNPTSAQNYACIQAIA